MSGSKGQRAARALQVQHRGPDAFLRWSSTGLTHQQLSAAKTPPRDTSEFAEFRQKLPRISAVGQNCVRYTVRLLERGGAPVFKEHRLPQEASRGDTRGKNGKRLVKSSDVLPSNSNAVRHEVRVNSEGEAVDQFYWQQQLGQRWLLSATLFGDRVITLEFASKHSAMAHAEAHAGSTLAWARSRGRGGRSKPNKARRERSREKARGSE